MEETDHAETEARREPRPALPRPASGRYLRRATSLLLVAASIVWLQTHFLSVRVVQTDKWPEEATYLKADADWRYGYVRGIHGAILIRTAASVQPVVLANVEEESLDSDRTKEVADHMKKELGQLRHLAVYEGLFYFSWVLLMRFGFPVLRRRLGGPSASSRRKARVSAVLTMVAVGYLLLPRIVLCYGASAYSTWAGPYAMSASGPYLPPSLWPGETVSYRPVLEIALLPMVFVLRGLGGGWAGPLLLSGLYGWILWRVVLGLVERFRVLGRGGSAA